MPANVANRTSVILMVLASWPAAGQPSARPEFEVASVKPAPPPVGNRLRVSMSGGPGTPDPGRINFENVTLRGLLTRAFDVKSYQISGPAWLDSERFNITAKIPPGTPKEQYLVMLQNLVSDRFRMTLHREQKELPSYVMVVAKNGSKLKPSTQEDLAKEVSADPPRPVLDGKLKFGGDGFPEMGKGVARGGIATMMMPGRARMVGNAAPVSNLAESLEQQLDRAVIDSTELTGKYDFTLTFEPEQSKMMTVKIGGDHPAPEGEAAPNLFTALQEQLGLKLEARKSQIEMLVIDHLEKTPVEN